MEKASFARIVGAERRAADYIQKATNITALDRKTYWVLPLTIHLSICTNSLISNVPYTFIGCCAAVNKKFVVLCSV